MSKMNELSYEIEQLYIEGHSAKMIAVMLECPMSTVLDVLESWSVADEPQDDEFSPYMTSNS